MLIIFRFRWEKVGKLFLFSFFPYFSLFALFFHIQMIDTLYFLTLTFHFHVTSQYASLKLWKI